MFLQGQAVDGNVYSNEDIEQVVGCFSELECAKWDRPRFIRHTKQAELLFTRDSVLLEFNEAEAVEDIIQESLQQNYRYSVQSEEKREYPSMGQYDESIQGNHQDDL